MKCIGYGIYDRKCTNEAGTPWTKYWCKRCDDIRRETVGKQMREIRDSFNKK